MDEPTLPEIPAGRTAATRKRARDMPPPPENSSTSSDPAVFSSDDDPALDNYQGHARRKRRYVGAWFDQHPASSDSALEDDTRPSVLQPRRVRGPRAQQPGQKREFKRHLDSGVWMGTDGFLTDSDDVFELEPAAAKLSLPPPRLPPLMPLPPARPRLTPGELEVQRVVRQCVENGTERVDLSGLDLETISDGLLDPISDIEPIPNVAKDVEFEKRDPRLQVFLFNNSLRSFPVSLFNAEHLTVLSLRANQLTTIPPAIGKLKNLEAVNIAQNYLSYLPGELLNLLQKGKLRSFNFQPNRFWKPDTASLPPTNPGAAEKYELLTFGNPPKVDRQSGWIGLTTKLHFRSPVQFFDGARNTYSTFKLPPVSKHPQDPTREGDDGIEIELEPFTQLAMPKEVTRELSAARLPTSLMANSKGARSLFELALRACAISAQADRIAGWLREDAAEFPWPSHLAPAVERAVETHREGGLRCSVCGRETLLPLAQWLEFRHIRLQYVVDGEQGFESDAVDLGQEPVPFLRVGCSWRCVPVRVEKEVEDE
ncbi:hypothetical protein VTJ49DRAFT_2388 [Mycothermus thermophilus]|uniref:Uncharacterized protein n=1 Tax=Humicola insolens TaxID=85995 RepID=A0ABR3VN07_HUMIN